MSEHFYVHADLLPQPDDSQDTWEQRAVMIAGMIGELARHFHAYLTTNAPVLLANDAPAGHFVVGMAFLAQGIEATGKARLEKRGLKPLDAEEEQLRMIRNRLAIPDLPDDEREFLLALLAHNLNCSSQGPTNPEQQPATDTDFPAEGFIIGGE